jgi:membrane associated rhomboid family serine protease
MCRLGGRWCRRRLGWLAVCSPFNISHTFRIVVRNLADVFGWLVYRTNTFPLVHVGFFHALMNILALTPLLERFEAEYGTLTTLALFLGRMHFLS